MNQDLQLKLQACLDGELSPSEQEGLRGLFETDPAARQVRADIQLANRAMRDLAAGLTVPATRDFYWSQISRRIQQAEAAQAHDAAEEEPFAWTAWWKRALVPAGALAAILCAGLIAGRQSGLLPGSTVSSLEASMASPGTFTYRDFDTGTTLVWLPYPAEKDMDDFDEDPTLP